jgi:acyl-CoA reductase-like NAD-dependent aldehyde dehydrogenase
VGFVGSTPIASTSTARRAQRKRVQAFGGAKNHMIVMPDADMDLAADALVGAGYWRGRRALHGHLRRRSRGRGDGGPA